MAWAMQHRVRASRAVDPQGFVFRIEALKTRQLGAKTAGEMHGQTGRNDFDYHWRI